MNKKETKWMQDFNEKLDRITKQFEELSESLPDVLAFTVEAASLIRYYDVAPERIEIEDLEHVVVEHLVELERIRRSINLIPYLAQFTLDRERIIIGMLLSLAKRKDIPPGEVCSMLRKHFPRETLMQVVSIEDVLEVFGTDEAIRWRQILEWEES